VYDVASDMGQALCDGLPPYVVFVDAGRAWQILLAITSQDAVKSRNESS